MRSRSRSLRPAFWRVLRLVPATMVWTSCVVATGPLLAGTATDESRIETVAVVEGGAATVVEVKITGDYGLTTLSLDNPPRFVCDLEGVRFGQVDSLQVGTAQVQRVRMAQYVDEPTPVVRVVVDLSEPTLPEIERAPGLLRLSFPPTNAVPGVDSSAGWSPTRPALAEDAPAPQEKGLTAREPAPDVVAHAEDDAPESPPPSSEESRDLFDPLAPLPSGTPPRTASAPPGTASARPGTACARPGTAHTLESGPDLAPERAFDEDPLEPLVVANDGHEGASPQADRALGRPSRWLVLNDGVRIQLSEPWRLDGRRVLFVNDAGTLSSVRTSAVDLIASSEAP